MDNETNEEFDDIIDVIRSALESLAEKLEEQGTSPAAIDFAMFETFSDRMIDREGEQSWRDILTAALDEPIEKHILH